MISVDELQVSWSLLEEEAPASEALRVRELTELGCRGAHPLVAVDAQGRRHVLFPVAPGVQVQRDTSSAGVHILPHRLSDAGAQRLFVDVVCQKPHLHELFAIIVTEMLAVLDQGIQAPDQNCRQVLDRWRELLDGERSLQFPLEKLTGVFGELWQMREIVKLNTDAVRCWVGPQGARHDLVNGSIALEVKATLSRIGRFFEIHGHEQLDPPRGGRLYLAAMKLEIATSHGESVRDLVQSIVASGGDRYLLLSRLARAGIGPSELDLCATPSFRVTEQQLYAVHEGFPRIVASSFIGGVLPPAVIHLSYHIDLSGLAPAPLSQEDAAEVRMALAAGASE